MASAETAIEGVATKTGRVSVVLREIARSGLAGLLAGLLVAGIGGRIVMRLAALLVPASAGRLTENGNAIGDITPGGTLALIGVGTLFFGPMGGTIWAVVSPWIPGSRLVRALLAMPIAVALTGVVLIQARNPDFQVLQHEPMVVVLLLLLVAVGGLVLALADAWLDRRLPAAGASPVADGVYVALAVAGAVLIFPVVLSAYLGGEAALGLALVAVGMATLARWRLLVLGRSPGAFLFLAGRTLLAIAIMLGFVALVPDVASAIGSGVAGGTR